MASETLAKTRGKVAELIRHRQFEQALQEIQALDGQTQQSSQLLDMEAMCYFRLKLYDEAANSYQRLAEENPKDATPLVNLGAVYNRQKKFPEAISVLRKAIQRDKYNFDAYFNLGYAHRGSSHPELAIPAYTEAIKLNPQIEMAHIHLANSYLETNNHRLAITHFQTALSLSPDSTQAQEGLTKAQDRINQGANIDNPFGRLVDVTQLSHKKSATAMKQLNDVDRKRDRDDVMRLAKAIRNAARHVSEEIREKMEPALLGLTRALIDGENHPNLIYQHHKQFHEELPRFEEGRRYLKRTVLELRGHEEEMNTPDLDQL